MKRAIFGLTAALLGVASAQAGDNCIGLTAALTQAEKSVASNVTSGFRALFAKAKPEDCGSLGTVLNRIANRERSGGRRLEDDKPFDATAAQADLDKAVQDDTVRAQLEAARSEAPDETTGLIHQAAILDTEGYYAARDLLVAKILQQGR